MKLWQWLVAGGTPLLLTAAVAADKPAADKPAGEAPRPEALFALLDADGDGALTAEEVGPKAWERIGRADVDGDGKVTPGELREAAKPAKPASDRPAAPDKPGAAERPAFKPEALLQEFDKNGDQALGQDELPERFWERLAAADTNGDGKLSLAELQAHRPVADRPNKPAGEGDRPTAADLLRQHDQNGDGALDANECPPRLWERLAKFDADGDGKVTPAEAARFHAAEGERPNKPAAEGDRPQVGHGELFAKADKNGDGFLTADECPERLWEKIARADVDGDGKVSLEELKALQPERPADKPREKPKG